MTKLNSKYVSWHYISWLLAQYNKKLGLFGMLGLAITISCCLIYMLIIVPLKEQLVLVQQQLESAKSDEMVLASTQKSSVVDITQEIVAFKKSLPQSNTLPQWLSVIDKSALKQGLKLNRGDYKLTRTKQGELSRYEIVLPVAGQYIQIRQFIANVLQQLPALALGEVKITRENTLTSIAEARLVFVMFLQGDSL